MVCRREGPGYLETRSFNFYIAAWSVSCIQYFRLQLCSPIILLIHLPIFSSYQTHSLTDYAIILFTFFSCFITVCWVSSPLLLLKTFTDLEHIMASSRDWDELLWAWEGWRNASGRVMPSTFEEYVGILNDAAQMNGENIGSIR